MAKFLDWSYAGTYTGQTHSRRIDGRAFSRSRRSKVHDDPFVDDAVAAPKVRKSLTLGLTLASATAIEFELSQIGSYTALKWKCHSKAIA